MRVIEPSSSFDYHENVSPYLSTQNRQNGYIPVYNKTHQLPTNVKERKADDYSSVMVEEADDKSADHLRMIMAYERMRNSKSAGFNMRDQVKTDSSAGCRVRPVRSSHLPQHQQRQTMQASHHRSSWYNEPDLILDRLHELNSRSENTPLFYKGYARILPRPQTTYSIVDYNSKKDYPPFYDNNQTQTTQGQGGGHSSAAPLNISNVDKIRLKLMNYDSRNVESSKLLMPGENRYDDDLRKMPDYKSSVSSKEIIIGRRRAIELARNCFLNNNHHHDVVPMRYKGDGRDSQRGIFMKEMDDYTNIPLLPRSSKLQPHREIQHRKSFKRDDIYKRRRASYLIATNINVKERNKMAATGNYELAPRGLSSGRYNEPSASSDNRKYISDGAPLHHFLPTREQTDFRVISREKEFSPHSTYRKFLSNPQETHLQPNRLSEFSMPENDIRISRHRLKSQSQLELSNLLLRNDRDMQHHQKHKDFSRVNREKVLIPLQPAAYYNRHPYKSSQFRLSSQPSPPPPSSPSTTSFPTGIIYKHDEAPSGDHYYPQSSRQNGVDTWKQSPHSLITTTTTTNTNKLYETKLKKCQSLAQLNGGMIDGFGFTTGQQQEQQQGEVSGLITRGIEGSLPPSFFNGTNKSKSPSLPHTPIIIHAQQQQQLICGNGRCSSIDKGLISPTFGATGRGGCKSKSTENLEERPPRSTINENGGVGVFSSGNSGIGGTGTRVVKALRQKFSGLMLLAGGGTTSSNKMASQQFPATSTLCSGNTIITNTTRKANGRSSTHHSQAAKPPKIKKKSPKSTHDANTAALQRDNISSHTTAVPSDLKCWASKDVLLTANMSNNNGGGMCKVDHQAALLHAPPPLTLPPSTSSLTFDTTLEDAFSSDFNPLIPALVYHCIQIIESYGLKNIGIYRVPGNNNALNELTKWLDTHHECTFEALWSDKRKWRDVNMVASVLKTYFRRLKVPLLTNEYYHSIIESNRLPVKEERLITLKKFIHILPVHHYHTLKYLMAHLHKVMSNAEHNRMNSQNLAIIFGPTLIRLTTAVSGSNTDNKCCCSPPKNSKDLTSRNTNTAASLLNDIGMFVKDMPDQCKIVESLIENYPWFFENSSNDKKRLLPTVAASSPPEISLINFERRRLAVANENNRNNFSLKTPQESQQFFSSPLSSKKYVNDAAVKKNDPMSNSSRTLSPPPISPPNFEIGQGHQTESSWIDSSNFSYRGPDPDGSINYECYNQKTNLSTLLGSPNIRHLNHPHFSIDTKQLTSFTKPVLPVMMIDSPKDRLKSNNSTRTAVAGAVPFYSYEDDSGFGTLSNQNTLEDTTKLLLNRQNLSSYSSSSSSPPKGKQRQLVNVPTIINNRGHVSCPITTTASGVVDKGVNNNKFSNFPSSTPRLRNTPPYYQSGYSYINKASTPRPIAATSGDNNNTFIVAEKSAVLNVKGYGTGRPGSTVQVVRNYCNNDKQEQMVYNSNNIKGREERSGSSSREADISEDSGNPANDERAKNNNTILLLYKQYHPTKPPNVLNFIKSSSSPSSSSGSKCLFLREIRRRNSTNSTVENNKFINQGFGLKRGGIQVSSSSYATQHPEHHLDLRPIPLFYGITTAETTTITSSDEGEERGGNKLIKDSENYVLNLKQQHYRKSKKTIKRRHTVIGGSEIRKKKPSCLDGMNYFPNNNNNNACIQQGGVVSRQFDFQHPILKDSSNIYVESAV